VDVPAEFAARFKFARQLIFDLDSNASEEQLEKLLSLTECYSSSTRRSFAVLPSASFTPGSNGHSRRLGIADPPAFWQWHIAEAGGTGATPSPGA
jgi:hypothetical protein